MRRGKNCAWLNPRSAGAAAWWARVFPETRRHAVLLVRNGAVVFVARRLLMLAFGLPVAVMLSVVLFSTIGAGSWTVVGALRLPARWETPCTLRIPYKEIAGIGDKAIFR